MTTMSPDQSVASDAPIRPFRFEAEQADLDDLRRRIAGDPLADQGARRRSVPGCAAGDDAGARPLLGDRVRLGGGARRRLNALPQFKTKIDGLDIHFIHVKSAHENALPLIMTHGWPGSIVELLETIGPLTDPTAHGGRRRGRVPPRVAVHPRLRLLRRADRARLGPDPHRTGLGRADAAPRLHPLRRAGRRRGLPGHRRDGPPGARRVDRHPHQPAHAGAGRRQGPERVATVRRGTAALDQLAAFHATGTGYFVEQATRPQTIGYALLDSPVALAAWMIDHDTDSLPEDRPRLRRRAALGQSHPRAHRRQHHAVLVDRHRGVGGALVLGGRTQRKLAQPSRLRRRSRSRSASPRSPGRSGGRRVAGSRRAYPNIMYFNEVDKGGHFAAWEEPQLFSEEMRAASGR